MSEELPEKITEEELPEKITDKDGYLYEKIPVEGRTEILVAGNKSTPLPGNKSTPLPDYYQKGKGENSMDILGNYDDLNDDLKIREEDKEWKRPKKEILQKNGYAVIEDEDGKVVTVKGHIFQYSNRLSEMFKYGHETRKAMKNWVKQITETDPNLYKKFGKDPNYKPPQKYNSNYNDYDSNSWGGRKRRRNSKKRNTKRRNSKKRRSHKRR
jgi:hypothetical protein